MPCDPFICAILFSLLESFKITLVKCQHGKIIEAKVAENDFFVLCRDFELNYFQNKILLSKVILDDSDRSNSIVQINVLHAIYSVIIIQIFDVKVVYEIHSQGIYIKALRY